MVRWALFRLARPCCCALGLVGLVGGVCSYFATRGAEVWDPSAYSIDRPEGEQAPPREAQQGVRGAEPSIPARGAARVAAGIAVHPAKFPYVGRLLEQYTACPAAVEAMSLHIVFSNDDDLALFREGLGLYHPGVRPEAWVPAVANITDDLLTSLGMELGGGNKQVLAAWKKWFGIAHLLDLGPGAPAYGLMLDAELLVYDMEDCGSGSKWGLFFERIRRMEATKRWPVAGVQRKLKLFATGGGGHIDGWDNNLPIIRGNANFTARDGLQGLNKCKTAGCGQVRQQLKSCLFSWWTDVPYVNLAIAKRMLTTVVGRDWQERLGRWWKYTPDFNYSDDVARPGYWKRLVRRIRFPRFEHICYQQWCVLNEGFEFWDVTNITGPAKWGSYLEDPVEGSRLAELRPLWVSAEVILLSRGGKIQGLSPEEPPLMTFHVDHQLKLFDVAPWLRRWEPLLKTRGWKLDSRLMFVEPRRNAPRAR